MIYKLINTNEDNTKIYAKIDDDNICRLTCTEDNPEFKTWLSKGNTPLPAESN